MRLRVAYLAELEQAGQKPVDRSKEARLLGELMSDGVDMDDEKDKWKPDTNPSPAPSPGSTPAAQPST